MRLATQALSSENDSVSFEDDLPPGCPAAQQVKTMTDLAAPQEAPEDAADAPHALTDRAAWIEMMDRLGDTAGYFEPMGAKHWAFFVDESPELLVTFEQIEDIMARPGQLPLGHDIAQEKGWSHLCIIADGETWYRDKRVYGYFDRLVDDAFFEDFDRVLFMGAGSEGYAAAAFSVAAPGCTVLAVTPRATLDPALTGWDDRARKSRKLDFHSRYGYAPDMLDGAKQAFVLFDPTVREDAMHAALFRASHVTPLRMPRVGGPAAWAIGHMQLTRPLVEAAMAGTLTQVSFGKLWRARRNFGPYLRQLLSELEASGRTGLQVRLCRNVTNRLNAPRFRKRLSDLLAEEIEAELKAEDAPQSAN